MANVKYPIEQIIEFINIPEGLPIYLLFLFEKSNKIVDTLMFIKNHINDIKKLAPSIK
ncbi:hypothetical protein [Flavobacterium sp. HNIBRBA15423]|uniref:hypothetical protein n=1 Tax=Flavobacterium sp. HNIBRBA15423 TaxID=3458683 RepID=UPI0040443890